MKSKKKAKIIILVLGMIFAISIISNRNFSNEQDNSEDNMEIRDETNLKTANSEITIITPENKTLTKPKSGFYPGTYGFENDKDDTFPIGWIEDGDGPDYLGKTFIVNSWDGHNKVLRIFDNRGDSRVYPYQEFKVEQVSGTIDLWIYHAPPEQNPSSTRTNILIENNTDKALVNIFAHNTELGFTNGTNNEMTGLSFVNEWFHVTIDFSGDGTYKGLSANTYNFTIRRSDGSLYYQSGMLHYNNYNIGNAAHLKIFSNLAAYRKTWVDAVGYSWEDNYNIGDNLNEGLLLSFENSTTLDWIGYSLDGQANITILGNTVIPKIYMQGGSHTIQVFGNNSLGTMYRSNVRFFTTLAFPIFIDNSDPNYSWSKTALEKRWCSGSGSCNDPYVIQEIMIDSQNIIILGKNTGSGIFINNSKNDYFIIKNCTVYNAGGGDYDAGIRLENTNNGTLINNNCSDNGYAGITLYNNCENITISRNTVNDNMAYGISLNDVFNVKLSGNQMRGCGVGIFGSLVQVSSHTIYTNNTVIGRPLYYYVNKIGLDADNFTDAGQVILINCKDSVISNLNVSYGSIGIHLYSCNNNNISGNTANNNNQGIFLNLGCNNNTISGNIANNNNQGILLNLGCNNNTISGNIANNNNQGIFLNLGCNNNTISGNTASNNNLYGISLNVECDDNTISGNTINDNGISGIYLWKNCDDNTISENIVYENFQGIELNCSDNLLFYNCIFNNSNNNAIDVGQNNWNNSVFGNYWRDYTGIDADYDGIGDAPYNVSGGGNIDYKPIMNYNPWFFKTPDDLSYEVGTTGHIIIWIVVTTTPSLRLNFNILMEGTSVKVGKLLSIKNEIIINVDGLELGDYIFSLQVQDDEGGTRSNGVKVTVLSASPEPSPESKIYYITEDDDDDDADDELVSTSIITASIVIAVSSGVIAATIILHALLMKKRIVPETSVKSKKKQPIK